MMLFFGLSCACGLVMSLFMQDVPGMQAGLHFGAADKGGKLKIYGALI